MMKIEFVESLALRVIAFVVKHPRKTLAVIGSLVTLIGWEAGGALLSAAEQSAPPCTEVHSTEVHSTEALEAGVPE